jgi:hypothetical protein
MGAIGHRDAPFSYAPSLWEKRTCSFNENTNMTYGKSAGWVFFIAMIALVNGQREGADAPSIGRGQGVMAQSQPAAPSTLSQHQPTLVDSRGAHLQGTARAQATKVSLPRT